MGLAEGFRAGADIRGRNDALNQALGNISQSLEAQAVQGRQAEARRLEVEQQTTLTREAEAGKQARFEGEMAQRGEAAKTQAAARESEFARSLETRGEEFGVTTGLAEKRLEAKTKESAEINKLKREMFEFTVYKAGTDAAREEEESRNRIRLEEDKIDINRKNVESIINQREFTNETTKQRLQDDKERFYIPTKTSSLVFYPTPSPSSF